MNLQDEIYYFYMQEKRTKAIRIILGILIPIVYTVIHIPPEVTVTQAISAGLVFLVIIYFVIIVLKRYKII
tara:strand:- start:56 stop:268 length:213 start_codon:yes stop_codon:yes gene_type:complete